MLDLTLDAEIETVVCVPSDDEEVNEVDEQTRAEKRKRRIAGCGKLWDCHVDPMTKRVIRGLYRCGYWRECEACAVARAEKIKGEMIASVMSAPLTYAECSDEDAEAVCRELGKESYMRFPVADNVNHLFYQNDGSFELGHEVNLADLEELDWQQVTALPPKRRSSGSLGRAKAKAKSESVKVEHFMSDAPQNVHDECVWNATRDTQDQNPTTAAEVEECIKEFTGLIKKYIIAKGYHVKFSYWRTYRVDMKHLDWSEAGSEID